MSRRAGNRSENTFMDEHANPLGYCSFAARGSRGPIDVLCFQLHRELRSPNDPVYWDTLQTLAVQVGTHRKPIAATLAELEAAPRPIGSLCVVARRLAQKGRSRPWQFITRAGKFASLREAIDAQGGQA